MRHCVASACVSDQLHRYALQDAERPSILQIPLIRRSTSVNLVAPVRIENQEACLVSLQTVRLSVSLRLPQLSFSFSPRQRCTGAR